MKNISEKITEKIQVIQDRIVTKPLWQVVLGLFLFLISFYLFVFSFLGGICTLQFHMCRLLDFLWNTNLAYKGIEILDSVGYFPSSYPQMEDHTPCKQNDLLGFFGMMKIYLEGAVFLSSLNLLFFLYIFFCRERKWALTWFDLFLIPFLWYFFIFIINTFRVFAIQELHSTHLFFGKILWCLLLAELPLYFLRIIFIFKDCSWKKRVKLFLYFLFLGGGYVYSIHTYGILIDGYMELLYLYFSEDFIFSWILTWFGLKGFIAYSSGEEEYVTKQCSWLDWGKNKSCNTAKSFQKVYVPQSAHPEVKALANTFKGGLHYSCYNLAERLKQCRKEAREEYRKANPANKK